MQADKRQNMCQAAARDLNLATSDRKVGCCWNVRLIYEWARVAKSASC